jgi:mono/diheme cytochrome c family protein
MSTKYRAVARKGLAAMAMLAASSAGLARVDASERAQIERGRYLVRIAGCNDCHTAGYAPSAGKVAEQDWLMGDGLGHKGQWGTTYPGNLRNYLNGLSEQQWLEVAKTARYRPPMPWFTLHQMADEDLRAIYRFVKHLGPAGSPVPAWVPPGHEPAGPHVTYPGLPN